METRNEEVATEVKIAIDYVERERQLVKLGTKHLNKHHHRFLIKLINMFKTHAGGVFA